MSPRHKTPRPDPTASTKIVGFAAPRNEPRLVLKLDPKHAVMVAYHLGFQIYGHPRPNKGIAASPHVRRILWSMSEWLLALPGPPSSFDGPDRALWAVMMKFIKAWHEQEPHLPPFISSDPPPKEGA